MSLPSLGTFLPYARCGTALLLCRPCRHRLSIGTHALLMLLLLPAITLHAQPLEAVRVVSKNLERTLRLPGEFMPYLSVDVFARVSGFVESVNVDRGSHVNKDDLLLTLNAPEMAAQLAEAQAKAGSVEAQRAEADAKLVAAQSVYDKLKAASSTPGAISGNELVLAEKAVDAARATVHAVEMSLAAAKANVKVLQDLEGYLKVTAPFDGMITERDVHPGALAGPGSPKPLLKLQQISRLRLVVAVPEAEVGGIVRGARVPFTVPAYPGETFKGTVARIARSVDVDTRSMPVELDVANASGRLAPGMYPEVKWPVRKAAASLLAPPSSIAVTTERSFVIRVRDGKAEWVDVRKGPASGDLVEIIGALHPGDEILRRGTDEIREGTTLTVKLAAEK